MANDENLKKGAATQFRAGEEQAEVARKGGIASGKARRRKGAARKILSQIAAGRPKVLTDIDKAMLAQATLFDPDKPEEEQEVNNEMFVWAGLWRKCCKGDVKAITLWLQLFGEDPMTILEERKIKAQEKVADSIKNSDGFLEAMKDVMEEVFGDGDSGDTPDTLEDSE